MTFNILQDEMDFLASEYNIMLEVNAKQLAADPRCYAKLLNNLFDQLAARNDYFNCAGERLFIEKFEWEDLFSLLHFEKECNESDYRRAIIRGRK